MYMSEVPPTGLVWRLSMRWRSAVDQVVAPFGLTHAQYSICVPLTKLDSPTQRQLADYTGLEPLYVSRLARALAQAGFIERTADPHDTRAVRLALTEHGHAVMTGAMREVHAIQDELTAPLGGMDAQRTHDFIAALNALLAVPKRTHRGERT